MFFYTKECNIRITNYELKIKNNIILEEIKKLNIPKSPGSYQFKDKGSKIIYIGKASNLRSRVVSYWQKGAAHTPAKHAMIKQIDKIDWIKADSEIEALLLEANLIKKYQPIFNIDLKDDKRFLYIKISTADEIPGIFATRKIDQAGKYYGPFTGAQAVRETIKAIRKIWPFCTQRKVGEKLCFYAQINRCLGPCGGLVSIPEYKQKVIRPIILFLEGKKKMIIEKLETNSEKLKNKMKKLEAGDKRKEELEYEIKRIKFQILNMRKVLEHVNIISVGEKYSSDVIELAKILGLSKVPERIEGYDISNIFCKEAVGSMVVFKGGEPDKEEYRKFKIKFKNESGDVGMLSEVLERRFKHARYNQKIVAAKHKSKSINQNFFWPDPDLIIVDGGKAQLNVVLKILKKQKLDIPALAVSKRQGLRSARALDKVFFPGQSKPLELPLASPALHIIKRVRDEAHRFAISYHRKLRSKKISSL